MDTANQLIDALGGTSAVANALGLTPSVVSSWRKAGTIPEWRHGDIIAAAKKRGIAVAATDVPKREKRAAA